MITFRCQGQQVDRLDHFAQKRMIDRTSALKLALQYYLNLLLPERVKAPSPDYQTENRPH